MVERLLDRFGALARAADLRGVARREPGVLMPTSQMRSLRELEPPQPTRGFDAVDHVLFARSPSGRPNAGVFVRADVLSRSAWLAALELADPTAPHLVFGWIPDGRGDAVQASVARRCRRDHGQRRGCPSAYTRAARHLLVPAPRCLGSSFAFARTHGV